MNLDQHILQVLAAPKAGARTVTIGDLARRFGLSPTVILPAAHRLVDGGLAMPTMVDVRGVPTLRGLLPVPVGTSATK